MLLDEREWGALERGVRQRAELLDLVLTDLYGPRELLSAGLLPPEVVYGHAGFVRPRRRGAAAGRAAAVPDRVPTSPATRTGTGG